MKPYEQKKQKHIAVRRDMSQNLRKNVRRYV